MRHALIRKPLAYTGRCDWRPIDPDNRGNEIKLEWITNDIRLYMVSVIPHKVHLIDEIKLRSLLEYISIKLTHN